MFSIKYIVVVTSLVFGAQVLGAPFIGDESLEIAESRLWGGRPARSGQFPYQVSLRRPHHFCGGSVISDRMVLTAAHCVENLSIERITVYAGTHLRLNFGEIYNLSDIIIHPKFDRGTVENDIAVLVVDRKFNFSDVLQPIEIMSEKVESIINVTITGWGTTDWGFLPNNLQYINTITMDNADCRDTHINRNSTFPVQHNKICTNSGIRIGTCHGDSGGPVAWNNKLVGIVSWGVVCARGYPDVHEALFDKLDFLTEIAETIE